MFIDSVIWIALKYNHYQSHIKATTLKEKTLSSKIIYITDYIVIETYNFLLRKVSSEIAKETLNVFLNSPKINILCNNKVSLEATKRILDIYPHLSFTDANIIWHCHLLDDNEIMSFDEGFDLVATIIRIS